MYAPFISVGKQCSQIYEDPTFYSYVKFSGLLKLFIFN